MGRAWDTVIVIVAQHYADRLTNLRRKLVRRLAYRRLFLSGVRAFGNPGAVHKREVVHDLTSVSR